MPKTIGYTCVAIVLLLMANSLPAQNRRVEGGTLISSSLPAIRVKVDGKFKYLGKFDFRLGDTAAGERFVFVDADKKKRVARLFIAQFEGFLPGLPNTYKYRFDNAMIFGPHKFRHNTYAYSNKQEEQRNPGNEGVLTAKFLREKGYTFEDEFMMSRFVTVPDAERKNELILFYIENVSPTGSKLSEFYSGDEETAVWQQISVGLKARSLKAFSIDSIKQE